MIMDPLNLRADESALRNVDPLARARARMESGEAQEAAAAAERQAAAHERFIERMATQEMSDRVQLWRQGYLDREVEAVRAQAEARRRAEIAELRDRLARLEGHGEWRPPTAESVIDAQLRRNADEAAAWAPQLARHRQAERRREIRRLEALAAAERREAATPGRAVTRGEAAPPPVSRVSGGLAPPADDPRRWPAGPPPLAMPEAAPYLPRGDY